MTVRELLSGLGEAHSAHNLMLRLRRTGVDAVFVDLTGWRGSESVTLERRIAAAFQPLDLARCLPIVTGYAQFEEGLVTLYGRGYSENTLTRIALARGAPEALTHNELPLPSDHPNTGGAGT